MWSLWYKWSGSLFYLTVKPLWFFCFVLLAKHTVDEWIQNNNTDLIFTHLDQLRTCLSDHMLSFGQTFICFQPGRMFSWCTFLPLTVVSSTLFDLFYTLEVWNTQILAHVREIRTFWKLKLVSRPLQTMRLWKQNKYPPHTHTHTVICPLFSILMSIVTPLMFSLFSVRQK